MYIYIYIYMIRTYVILHICSGPAVWALGALGKTRRDLVPAVQGHLAHNKKPRTLL